MSSDEFQLSSLYENPIPRMLFLKMFFRVYSQGRAVGWWLRRLSLIDRGDN